MAAVTDPIIRVASFFEIVCTNLPCSCQISPPCSLAKPWITPWGLVNGDADAQTHVDADADAVLGRVGGNCSFVFVWVLSEVGGSVVVEVFARF